MFSNNTYKRHTIIDVPLDILEKYFTHPIHVTKASIKINSHSDCLKIEHSLGGSFTFGKYNNTYKEILNEVREHILQR